MPIYEYECTRCKERFELLQTRQAARKSNSPPCSGCSSRRTRRLMSAFVGRSGASRSESRSLGGSGCGSCSRSSCAGCHSA